MQLVPLLLRLREASTPAHVRNMEDVNKTELSEMHDYPNWREEQQKQFLSYNNFIMQYYIIPYSQKFSRDLYFVEGNFCGYFLPIIKLSKFLP